MASNGGLTGIPLRNNFDFNWLFLVVLGVCGIVSLFFIFYFNRLFATLVSYGLRAWTWHRYRVYIEFQALQISLLAGRVFFTGFRYHGENETIFVHSGYVTWCYWLRTVRQVELSRKHEDIAQTNLSSAGHEEATDDARKLSSAEKGGSSLADKLPCRVNISLSGAEWFVYNRSPAYDAVVQGMTGDLPTGNVLVGDPTALTPDSKLRKRTLHSHDVSTSSNTLSGESRGEASPSASEKEKDAMRKPLHASDTLQTSAGLADDEIESNLAQSSLYLRLLPIHIECQKAAVVLGNENTKSVLITKAEKVSGEIDASKASNPIDQYRQMFNFDFEHPVVQIKPNDDYKEDQTAMSVRVKRGAKEEPVPRRPHFYTSNFWHRQRKRAWHKLQDLVPRFRSSVESFASSMDDSGTHSGMAAESRNWQGLSRYLEDGEKDDKARWSSIEYATVTTIADCPQARLSFYWDVAGVVPQSNVRTNASNDHEIATEIAPAFGVDLCLQGAIINYGPWADRQRADLQRVFFPTLSKDTLPNEVLAPGQTRVSAEFKVYVELTEDTILRVPIREESKNWKWTKQADTMGAKDKQRKGWSRRRKTDQPDNSETRPFGWLDLKVGKDTTASYVMDMFAHENGFSNNLKLDLPNLEVTTSVNHGVLLRSTQSSVFCDLSNPLAWNGHHLWKFNLSAKDLELFLLREHVFLLIDLIDDWASGPPQEYLTFSPFKYLINVHLDDFQIFLNLNDSNIINNPSDFDDNTFINIFGEVLDANVGIPLEHYRPHRTEVTFRADARDGGLKLHVPPWSTQASLLTSNIIATLKELIVEGTYQYCATTSSANTDTLVLHVHGDSPVALLYGFVIRYYLKVKDNYFGDDIHFKTLEEYQSVIQSRLRGDHDNNNQAPFKKSNDLDVILSVTADNTNARIPTNLYSSSSYTNIEIPALALDLRFTNYYMDVDVEFKTLAFSQGSEQDGISTPNSTSANTELFIDGIKIYGNRLFGLPPAEPTYICNWDFAVGAVTGECSAQFLRKLASGGKGLGFSFDDEENALPLLSEISIYDVTFLRADIESVKVWVHIEELAFLFSTGNLYVNFDDRANSTFSSHVKVKLPDLQLACVDAESALRHKSRNEQSVATHMLVQTSLTITIITRKLDFLQQRQLQQDHVRYHDQRTHRADFLLLAQATNDELLTEVDTPAMCMPLLPVPITGTASHPTSTFSTQHSSIAGHLQSSRKSSFLSQVSLSQKSTSSAMRSRSPRKQNYYTNDPRSQDLTSSLAPPSARTRDVSASSGRPSSFHSAVDEYQGFISSSISFSSAYIAPHFPLQDVEPSEHDLPTAAALHMEEDDIREKSQPRMMRFVDEDETTEHVTVMVESATGVRAFMMPQAVEAVACMLTAFQPVEPVDILDSIQTECISDILASKKKDTNGNSIMDLRVSVPVVGLRFLNTSESTPDSYAGTIDQYDLVLSGLKLTTRSKSYSTVNSSSGSHPPYSAVHVAIKTLGLSAKERYESSAHPQAVTDISVNDTVLWMSTQHQRSINCRIRDIQYNNATSRIEYLASMIHRTKTTATDISTNFTKRLDRQKSRLKLFVYLIIRQEEVSSEPLFLSRPSYVLRSADNHVRIHDTWKILGRLRHAYNNIADDAQLDICQQCRTLESSLPINAKNEVLQQFNKWGSWDFDADKDCLVVKKVFGIDRGPEVSVPESIIPTSVTFESKSIRLLLDPGPKQNEISISSFSVALDSKQLGSEEDSSTSPAASPDQITVVRLNCPDAFITLNWELYELADNLLKLYQPNGNSQSLGQPETTTDAPSKLHNRHDIHVFVALDQASLTLDTINLRNIMTSNNMRASFILAHTGAVTPIKLTSLMLAASKSEAKLLSHHRELMTYQLRRPSVFVSQEVEHSHAGGDKSIFRVAANSHELSFLLIQDIPALIEVADLVLGDEIGQIYRLNKRIPKMQDSRDTAVTAKSRLPFSTRINVALFLDEYYISLALLHGLVYDIRGVVARASVSSHLGKEVILDFDIKENLHELYSASSDSTINIASLHIPPTNGRINSHMSDEGTAVSVFASIEPIELEATALHGLTTAFNRPEISGIVSDVKADVDALQAHIQEIFGDQTSSVQPAPAENTQSPIVYDAHVTWAGLGIKTTTLESKPDQNIAQLEFRLGCVQLMIANRLDQQSTVLEYPEVRVGLRHIGLGLTQGCKGHLVPCGSMAFSAFFNASSRINDVGNEVRSFHVQSDGLEVNLFPDTASSVVDILNFLQDKIKDLDFRREKKYLRRLRQSKPRVTISENDSEDSDAVSTSTVIFASMYSLEIVKIQISWIVDTRTKENPSNFEPENLVLSLKRIELSTRKENSARLTITDLQLQMVPESDDKTDRTFNSALLPEVIFNVGYVSTSNARRLVFQAAGKSLDLRLTSQFILPAAELQKSIYSAIKKVRAASEPWIQSAPEKPAENKPRRPFFGKKRMESLLVDADFAGAVVHLSAKKSARSFPVAAVRSSQARYHGQSPHAEADSSTTLRSPGLAWKIEYKDNGLIEPALHAEVKVDASNNILYPAVVPLILEITSAIKEVVSDEDDNQEKSQPKQPTSPQKILHVDEDNILAADPSVVLGRTRLNLGLRICRQEFSLSCQPIARVAAIAKFEDIYMTINTVRSTEHGHFFAASAAFTKLQMSVQHVYSRESTGSFDVESVFLSLMNSKHVSGTSGLKAILNISPMKVLVNAKQLQDFLLFRDIWMPPELRQQRSDPVPTPLATQNQPILVQRYQQVAATGAFPWDAAISIAELDVQLDLGQAIGRSAFIISKFWVSSKKNSDWEQNLCFGFEKIGVDCTGRMSGFVALQEFQLQTSIRWPAREMAIDQTPLVEGSLKFSKLRLKAAFDYQAFLIADITSVDFFMHNIRQQDQGRGDRLVAMLDGDAVQVFCTATSASQALALYQAFQRLVQDKQANYQASLAEIQKFMRRKSVAHLNIIPLPQPKGVGNDDDRASSSPISLHTHVIVTLKALNIGAFPNTFADHQIFKLEALNAQASFAVIMAEGRIHSRLSLTLGQLRIGLARVNDSDGAKPVGDLRVEDVVRSATGSRGGTILKVPKVSATMQTWQVPNSNHIDYIFKSSFEGKVEVGWNYSRISYIRNMWATHSKALALKLGKPLPPSAVKITGVPGEEGENGGGAKKITAEVNVPLSKYDYTALEPAIIETPQLRDMGEATPPLEWIGLHREKLPNLTHQIVIVTLLEVAREVEEAYGKILGSS